MKKINNLNNILSKNFYSNKITNVVNFSTSFKPIKLNGYTSSKSIVVFGSNLTSTIGLRFTLNQLAMVKLAAYRKSVIIGLLLSDGWSRFSNQRSKNALLGFKQSLAHFVYLWFVFNLLSHYCSSLPMLKISKRNDKTTYALEISTRAMPCITEVHNLFYVEGKKVIPNNIYELLDPIALAHWISGDGSYLEGGGLLLCTDSYSIQEVVLLINVLIIRYNLKCTFRIRNKNKYRIYISRSSIKILQSFVSTHMESSMLYKIHL